MSPNQPRRQVMSRRTSLSAAIAIFFTVCGGSAFAGTNYWVNNGGYSGTFNDGSGSSHWSTTPGGGGGGSAPTTSDVVIFDNNQTTPYTVNFNGNIQSSTFDFRTDNVILDLSGYTYTARLDGFGNPPFNYGDGNRIGVGNGVTNAVVVSSS